MKTPNAMMLCVILALAALSASSFQVFGGDNGDAVEKATKKIDPIDMDKADVEKFVKILPKLCVLFKDIGQGAPTAKSTPQKVVKALVTNAKVKTFAAANGYAGSEALMKAYVGVMSAFCYLQLEELKRNMAQLPPDMVAAVAAQLKNAENMMQKQKRLVTPKTIASVKPYMQVIATTIQSAYSGK